MKSTPFYAGERTAYTGPVEDRVNLWPLGYYREPALSVLWPLFSLTDDHLAVRPFYSQYRQKGALADYDEFNLLWPLCQFDTLHHRHRIFPAFWGDNGSFALFPLVFRHRHSFTLFPLVWWGDCGDDHHYFNLFPLWWHNQHRTALLPFYYRDKNTLNVIPFYCWSKVDGVTTEWYGPYGRASGNGRDSDWCVPFYYRDAERFVSLPYCRGRSDGEEHWAAPLLLSWGKRSEEHSLDVFLLGLGGASSGFGDSFRQWALPFFYRSDSMLMTPLFGWDTSCHGSWVLPCYYNDDDRFLSAFYWRRWSTDAGGVRRLEHGSFPFWYATDNRFVSLFWIYSQVAPDTYRWCLPPALSLGTDGPGLAERTFLLGLGGYSRSANGDFADWIAPLYYRDEDGLFLTPLLSYFDGQGDFFTPLGGRMNGATWMLPLWWQDDRGFLTLLYGRFPHLHGAGHVIPPLMSFWDTDAHGLSSLRVLAGFGGLEYDSNGKFDRSWLFPLWHLDQRGLISLPLIHSDSHTAFCLFAGVTHAARKYGGWFWPLAGGSFDRNMPAAEAMLNSPRLDSKVTVAWKGSVRDDGYTNRWNHVEGATSANDETWLLSGLSTGDRYISWSARGTESKPGTVVGTERWEYGNLLVYRRQGSRTVTFDATTREKTGERVTDESGAVCNLFWHSTFESDGDGLDRAEKSILWRFWHYERKNGDVAVDSFPFFTYDSKRNGYSKTSLLWRLFRYERDPKSGTSVDILFIPVWR